MAVSIDTVYQRVLAIANKEQRGYITPQEFNLFANQAQMSMFEQYFYDVNQFLRTPGNDKIYSDMVPLLEEKIAIFKKRHEPVVVSDQYGNAVLPNDLYRLGTVLRLPLTGVGSSTTSEIELISEEDLLHYESSPLASPSKQRPVYLRKSSVNIKIFPFATSINTGLNKSATQYFQQTGTGQYNGQNNQFSIDGCRENTNSGQGAISTTVFLQPTNTSPIKVGQTVTGVGVINSPATLVSSYSAGATTTLAAAVVVNDRTITVASADDISIGQLVNISGTPFPTNPATFVIGVQGTAVKLSESATGTASINDAAQFNAKLVLSQNPSAAIANNTTLTFNENNAAYIEVGQSAVGGLPANTTVTAVSDTAITMSNEFTAGIRTVTFISDDIKCNYIRRPVDVVWGYNVINSVALYNAASSVNFELHESEETQLVVKILGIAGIAMENIQLYQIASQEEGKQIQQEKQ